MFPAKFHWFSVFPSVTTTVSLILAASFTVISAATEMQTTTANNQSQSLNASNIQTRSPPPPKSLFNSQLFQSDNLLGGVMKTFMNSLPIRESYIAFEQAHPADASSSQEYDQYFKPNKFSSLSYDSSPPPNYYTKLQNSYSFSPPPPPPLSPSFYQPQPPQSPYYNPFSPPQQPPPPPPPPPNQYLRLVKIPGELNLTVNGGWRNDLEVTCEFPPYLLIVQQIYWHVIPPPTSLLLPYGTFYDSNNGFAPRVTVRSISKWKSVLTVRDYSPDDYGTYRCVSTAILPEEPEPTYSVQLPQFPPTPPTSLLFDYPHPSPHHHYPHHQHNYHPHHESLELRSAASTLNSRQMADNDEVKEENGDSTASFSQQRERKIKFVSRKKRESGAFGVHAPFFKPQYGIYRIFKEVRFFGESLFGFGSDIVENTLNTKGKPENKVPGSGPAGGGSSSNKVGGSSSSREENKQTKDKGGRAFSLFTRQSKVLF